MFKWLKKCLAPQSNELGMRQRDLAKKLKELEARVQKLNHKR